MPPDAGDQLNIVVMIDLRVIDIAEWLLAISVVPATIGGLAWHYEKLSTGMFGMALGLALGAIFVLARY